MSRLQIGGNVEKNTFGDVAAGNYAEFDSETGFLFFYGDARAWLDCNFGVGALQRGASAPDLVTVNGTGIQTLAFDGINTLEQVSTILEINHNWAEGTICKPHIHWYPTTAGAGNVKWNLEVTITPIGEVVTGSTTMSVVQATGGVAWMHKLAIFPDYAATGVKIGAQSHFRLYRDPTDPEDTYAADAAIMTIGMHRLMDTLGSRQVAVK